MAPRRNTQTRKAKKAGRRGTAKKTTTTTNKTRLTGFTNAPNTAIPLGVVDPESNIRGTIENLDDAPCDAMLVLVDPQKNIDKFFVLQLIKRNGRRNRYVVYSRWGRTGTAGQAMEQEFDDFDDAADCFEEKFEDKTGLSWDERKEPTVGGKHRFIEQDFASKRTGFVGGKWQYWVDDGIDGKNAGWYDYDARGAVEVERLFTEHAINPRLTNRLVKSGVWTYDVDLVRMVQTNVQHPNRTSRRIRRCATPLPTIQPVAFAYVMP